MRKGRFPGNWRRIGTSFCHTAPSNGRSSGDPDGGGDKLELNFSSLSSVASRGVEAVINFLTAERRGEVSITTAAPAGAKAAR